MFQAAGKGSDTGQGEEMDPSMSLEEFIASGRTGRRNAMPDILNENHAGVTTAGLAENMGKLNCAGLCSLN